MNVLRQKQQSRYRVFVRAARAWRDGKPHRAREIVLEAGLDKYWPDLQRALLAHARSRYEAAVPAVERIYV